MHVAVHAMQGARTRAGINTSSNPYLSELACVFIDVAVHVQQFNDNV